MFAVKCHGFYNENVCHIGEVTDIDVIQHCILFANGYSRIGITK